MPLRRREADPREEARLTRQREYLDQAQCASFRDEGIAQGAPHATRLPVRMDRERGELREFAGAHLESARSDQRAVGHDGDMIFLDVTAQVIAAARQQISGGDERRDEGLERRDVGEARGSDGARSTMHRRAKPGAAPRLKLNVRDQDRTHTKACFIRSLTFRGNAPGEPVAAMCLLRSPVCTDGSVLDPERSFPA